MGFSLVGVVKIRAQKSPLVGAGVGQEGVYVYITGEGGGFRGNVVFSKITIHKFADSQMTEPNQLMGGDWVCEPYGKNPFPDYNPALVLFYAEACAFAGEVLCVISCWQALSCPAWMGTAASA